MINNSFYSRFEERFRGDRNYISSTLSVYLPLVSIIQSYYPNGLALDLGCGRGEWLELLQKNNWSVKGVDLNSVQLQHCRELGLSVVQEDVYTYIKNVETDSVAVLSGFHIAEHLSTEVLMALLHEAWRVLKPGGILILETPNPENILVGTCTFYLDPTHRQPIPPRLLGFLAEEAGFSRQRVLRLRGPAIEGDELPKDMITLTLSSYADYALVVQKNTTFDTVGLSELFNKIDEHYTIESRSLLDHIEALDNQRENFINRVKALENIIYNSQSWKITKPLREMREIITGVKKTILKKITTCFKFLLLPLKKFLLLVQSSTLLNKRIKAFLIRFPNVYERLRQIALIIHHPELISYYKLSAQEKANIKLPKQARKIFAELKLSTKRN